MPKTENVMIIGASATGKSCIFKSATEENYNFSDTMQATIAVTKPVVKKCALKDNSQKNLKVWDCGGQERFKSITNAFLRDATGCIVVYGVDNPDSVKEAKNWVRSLVDSYLENKKKWKAPKFIVIAANKTDLPDSMTKIKDWKEQNDEICAMINKEYPTSARASAFGTSAKSGLNIEEVFTAMAELVASQKSDAGKKKKEKETAELKNKPCCMIQ